MIRYTIVSLAVLWIGIASAAPVALEPATAGGVSVSLPKGWKTTTDPSHGVFVAQRDPNRKDAPVALVMVQASGSTSTEDQLLDAVVAQVAKNLKVVKREAVPGGGHVLIADGMAGDVKVRVGVIAVAAGGAAIVAMLASKPDEFDKLGGIDLVALMLKSIALPQPAQPAQPAAPPPPAPAAASGGAPSVPALGRALSIKDLAGEWSDVGTSIQGYVNTQTGNYAGYSAVSVNTTYTIAADGALSIKFLGVTTGNVSARAITEQTKGTVTVTPKGMVMIARKNGDAINRTWYVVRGWIDSPDQTIMKINGPWQLRADGTLEDDAWDPLKATNYNSYWVRKTKKP